MSHQQIRSWRFSGYPHGSERRLQGAVSRKTEAFQFVIVKTARLRSEPRYARLKWGPVEPAAPARASSCLQWNCRCGHHGDGPLLDGDFINRRSGHNVPTKTYRSGSYCTCSSSDFSNIVATMSNRRTVYRLNWRNRVTEIRGQETNRPSQDRILQWWPMTSAAASLAESHNL